MKVIIYIIICLVIIAIGITIWGFVTNWKFINKKKDTFTTIKKYEWRPVLIDNIFKTNHKLSIKHIHKLSLPKGARYEFGAADPFLINGYVFAEIYDKDGWENGKRGCIAVAKHGDTLKFEPIIKENFHMSFPHVFNHKSTWYMIPETYQSRNIRLYKADKFPYKWKFIKNIFPIDGIDSIPFKLNNTWYLFTTSQKTNITFILSTDNFPTGKWKIVKKNILPKKFRGGGNALYHNGQILLPVQEPCTGRGRYGCDLDLYKVAGDLSMTKYKKIKPPSNATGVHHLSFDPFTNSFMVDLKEVSPKKYYIDKVDKFWKDNADRHVQEKIYKAIGEKFKNITILDIGCRWYDSKNKNHIANPTIQYMQMEPNSDQKSQCKNNDKFLECTVEDSLKKYPQLLNSFDIILDFGVLGWTTAAKNINKYKYLENIYKMLKTNGMYVLKIDNDESWKNLDKRQKVNLDQDIYPRFKKGLISEFSDTNKIDHYEFYLFRKK